MMHPIVQRSYINQYDSLLKKIKISKSSKVLDIGSGLGFMKPLVLNYGSSYVGIESDLNTYNIACKLYGENGFIHGYFPTSLQSQLYELIFVLSCVDEVDDKSTFLKELKLRLYPGVGEAHIAVRNGGFLINRFKYEFIISKLSKRAQISASDIRAKEWSELIESSGLQIIEIDKFWRPWIIGFSFIGLKNILYKIISYLLPIKYSYMIIYKCRI
jgi:hypothetical protein